MPANNPVQTIRLPGFEGGLNRDADEFQLEPNEVPDCMNVDFGLRGAISKRRGYVRYDDPSEDEVYASLVAWHERGGSKWLVAVMADEIAYSSGATFAEQATGWAAPSADIDGGQYGMAVYEAQLYVSSLAGNTWVFDGSTWTELTDTVLDEDAGAHFPRAAHLETNYERVWAGNLWTDSVEHPSRVWFSNIGDGQKWGPSDWIDVEPDDGTIITGLKVFGGNMIVFKESSVFSISGSDANSFTLFNLDSQIGTTCPRTIVAEGDRLIFFDPLSGVWQFDGSGFQKLDDAINLYLLNGLTYSAAHKSSGFIWRGRYYLSVPWDGDTTPSRTFVLDLRTNAWTQYDFGAADWESRDDDVYAVGVRNGEGIYTMLTGLSDNGEIISSYVETSWLAPENESVKQRLRRADFAFSALGDTDVTVKMNRDFDVDATFTKTINTAPGGGLWGTFLWGEPWGSGVDQVFKRETGWPKRWRVMQLRFEEATLTGDFQLNRILLHISSQQRVRGEP